ncbi:MAG: hypothetical protein GF344_15700 [Chitinivibrionales bacterium]|nr:hypothetical protein [Chitinivibrionales bacterium]MBD3358145.1 hypothetical protein [Chitinivibrionales bacterium]
MRQSIRDWKLTSLTTYSLEEVAALVNPVIRGWINYYGAYCRSALKAIRHQIDLALSPWAMRKYKWLHRRHVEALRWLGRVRQAAPELFVHWQPAAANG